MESSVPGSQPSANRDDYPSMAELRAAFRAVYADLCDVAITADPALLAAENPYAPARAGYPTSGEFVAYLLSGHLAHHLGQLATWRRSAGIGA
jgi:hypothetical protein